MRDPVNVLSLVGRSKSFSHPRRFTRRLPVTYGACAALVLWLTCGSTIYSQTPAQSSPAGHKEAAMTHHANGTFEVKVTPLPSPDADAALGAMSLDKKFHGALEATGQGRMLTAGTAVKDSAAYVAIERVNGTLDGRTGSFVLQHSATMTRGTPQQKITVVPDSGTDQLTGLAGTMTIKITDGKHFYEFEYTLPTTTPQTP